MRHGSGLVVETRGHLRLLTLDRPERRNALSSALQADLVEELLTAGSDGTCVVVSTGQGTGVLRRVRPRGDAGRRRPR